MMQASDKLHGLIWLSLFVSSSSNSSPKWIRGAVVACYQWAISEFLLSLLSFSHLYVIPLRHNFQFWSLLTRAICHFFFESQPLASSSPRSSLMPPRTSTPTSLTVSPSPFSSPGQRFSPEECSSYPNPLVISFAKDVLRRPKLPSPVFFHAREMIDLCRWNWKTLVLI